MGRPGGPLGRSIASLPASALVAQQVRQLGDAGGDAPRLVTGEQLARGTATGLVLAIDEGQSLPVGVAHDEVGANIYDGGKQ
jgi:hypothetical protein